MCVRLQYQQLLYHLCSHVSTAADLMQDLKTGYLTLSSAKSMFASQLVGTAMGCVIAHLLLLHSGCFGLPSMSGHVMALRRRLML